MPRAQRAYSKSSSYIYPPEIYGYKAHQINMHDKNSMMCGYLSYCVRRFGNEYGKAAKITKGQEEWRAETTAADARRRSKT
eukprot:2248023-Pleurochrysis_carterae.AAC.1